MRTPTLLVLTALTWTACRSNTVPADLIALYDVADPGGIIEIEVDRDGYVREMEADIPVADLPPAIRDAALDERPGARITGAEREITEARIHAYEVKLVHEGRGWELVIDPAGNILETEKELRPDEVPDTVLEAADAVLPRGSRTSIEAVEGGGRTLYHVKKTSGAGKYKIVLTPAGDVVRVVREQAAEIEIPIDPTASTDA